MTQALSQTGFVRGRAVDHDVQLKCDVCIVGSGAGGSTAAWVLARAGLRVVVLEAGGYHTRADFNMSEADVYPVLYQEGMKRATADRGVAILQGRSVGGGTTINWTTCFRTPERTLAHWRARWGLDALTEAALDPHWAAMEGTLGIHGLDPSWINENNRKLWDGCERLGWERQLLRRNTLGCRKSGYCGMGCPFDAKRGMLVTLLPAAVSAGATVLSDCDVARVVATGDRIVRVEGALFDPDRDNAPTGRRVVVEPEVCIVSGGALNSPALLMRSEVGLRGGLVGQRTWLHPVVAAVGEYADPVEPFYGAPQTVSSHHFIERSGIGFFLEAAPLHPVIFSTAIPGHGAAHAEAMAKLSHVSGLIALMVDGFDDAEPGGTVSLYDDGMPRLDYDFSPRLVEGFRAGLKALAAVHLAAGAKRVLTGHEPPVEIAAEGDIGRLDGASYEPNRVAVFSAHQMGGCWMGGDPRTSVVDADLRHHDLANLYVMDGSVFPTSLGVNPQLSIYGLVHRAATRLARRARSGVE